MTMWLSLGLVGFGVSGGLFPELRLGIFAIGWCRGAITDRIAALRERLRLAIEVLRP